MGDGIVIKDLSERFSDERKFRDKTQPKTPLGGWVR